LVNARLWSSSARQKRDLLLVGKRSGTSSVERRRVSSWVTKKEKETFLPTMAFTPKGGLCNGPNTRGERCFLGQGELDAIEAGKRELFPKPKGSSTREKKIGIPKKNDKKKRREKEDCGGGAED